MRLGSWDKIFNNDEFDDFYKVVLNEYEKNICYPLQKNIFAAFDNTSYEDVKVVIIGQDPYHGEGEANGFAFSVNDGIKIPPSLRNIYKELENDLHINKTNGDLSSWSKEGVLLINSILTVEKDLASSHKKLGWEKYTNEVIKYLNEKETPVVFILWGNYARNKKELITNNKHLIIESVHPSPLSASRGFFGSKPFSKTNKFLETNNIAKINW